MGKKGMEKLPFLQAIYLQCSNKEAYRKPQGSYKNFQDRNPYNIFVAILVQTMTTKRHFETK